MSDKRNHWRIHSPYMYDINNVSIGEFMTPTNSALSAINKEDGDSLVTALDKLTKEEIQEVAMKCKIQSATFLMRGTWIERTSGNLLSPDGDILQSDIFIDRGYKGNLQQHYGPNSLHYAAIVALIASDFDEDNFSAGDMLFGEDRGCPADSVNFDADCKSEDRYIKNGEIDYGAFEEDECEVDDNDTEMSLTNAFILPHFIELIFKDGKKIKLQVYDGSDNVTWFLFASLFMSSKKTFAAISQYAWEISEFMWDRFEIDVRNQI